MTGAELIAADRATHEARGFTAEHDDAHGDGELAEAAAWLASPIGMFNEYASGIWPHGWDLIIETDRIRELTIAGALIAAEIDRLQRKGEREKGE